MEKISWQDITSAQNFDDRSRLLSPDVFNQLRTSFQEGSIRVALAKLMAESAPNIVKNTAAISYKEKKISSYSYFPFLHEIDYFLRYAAYSILARDIHVLEARKFFVTCMILDFSVVDFTDIIVTMKKVLYNELSHVEASINQELSSNSFGASVEIESSFFQKVIDSILKELNNYFDLLLILFKEAKYSISLKSESLSVDHQSWEPKNYQQWLVQDKLAQYIRKYNAEEDNFLSSAKSFFESLQQLPSRLREIIWREREIIAYLYVKTRHFDNTSGFVSVGVARRSVEGKDQLVGIYRFMYGVPIKRIRDEFKIPDFLLIESSIPSYRESCDRVPLLIEYSELPENYNTQINLKEEQSMAVETSTIVLQSGDVIAGTKPDGSSLTQSRVTLSAIVTLKKHTTEKQEPFVLSVYHGLRGCSSINTCEYEEHTNIGMMPHDYEDNWNQSLFNKLDVVLYRVERESFIALDPHLKWIKERPKKSIPVFSQMSVQMHGGTSKHVLGIVDESMTIYPGSTQPLVPDFSASIPAELGDSGALLVIGHNSNMALPSFLNDDFLEDWSNLLYAMQGILLAGVRTSSGKKAVFRPTITVMSWLKLNLYS